MHVDDHYKEPHDALRVAILYTSERRLSDLVKVLESNALAVIAREKVADVDLERVNALHADVILVDLDESAEQALDVLENILENAERPLLFNDNATTEFVVNTANPEWGKRLAQKLANLAKSHPRIAPASPAPQARVPEAPPAVEAGADIEVTIAAPLPAEPLPVSPAPAAPVARKSPPLKPSPPLPKVEQPKKTPAAPPKREAFPPLPRADRTLNGGPNNLVVLGASLGGPLAVREFLSKLPNNLPVAFVLAQHIGASHVDLLAEQLDRVTPLKVVVGKTGHQLKHQEVVLAPVDERIVLDNHGRVVLKPKGEDSIYSPCIDHVMEDMAERFGSRCLAIVFSGMGNDGEKGCHAVANHGGVVWAQDAESCVISSMPDNARKTGHVVFSGTPVDLARELVKHYSATTSMAR